MRFPRGTRKVADTIVGYILVAAGIVMLVTPGPGIVTVIAGLAVLARHYRWAERLKTSALERIRDTGTRLRARRAAQRAAEGLAPEPVEERDAA